MVAGASPRATGDGLAVVGATVAYPGGRALTDVSVAFGRGRVHVLAGENGAGKSTLIKLVTGGRRPDRGQVLLDGIPVDLRGPADAAARGIWPLIENGQVVAALCEPSSLDFFQQVQYLFNLNRQVTGIDWRANPAIRVIPRYTDMGSFIVDQSNVAVMKALGA